MSETVRTPALFANFLVKKKGLSIMVEQNHRDHGIGPLPLLLVELFTESGISHIHLMLFVTFHRTGDVKQDGIVDLDCTFVEASQLFQLDTCVGRSKQEFFPLFGLSLTLAGFVPALNYATDLCCSLCALLGFQQQELLVSARIAQSVHILGCETHLCFQVFSAQNLKIQPRLALSRRATFDLLLFTHQTGQMGLHHNQSMFVWHLEVNASTIGPSEQGGFTFSCRSGDVPLPALGISSLCEALHALPTCCMKDFKQNGK